jgi:uncharacterized protein YndB with AHSA1/START domain
VTPLPYSLERTIVIGAKIKTVFTFFTDAAHWAAWWGAGSTIDPRPGGTLRICHSNGFVSVGNVLEVEPPNRFVFTFSLQTTPPTPAEDSRVTIRLAEHSDGTQLTLKHELQSAAVRDLMHQGWRFQLSMFSNAVADLVHAGAANLVDEWFALWSEPEASLRQAKLERIAVPSLRFRDRHSALEGTTEIIIHVGASQRFMPGMVLKRRGGVRQCQGTALADWTALSKDGVERMSGTNVFVFNAGGKIASVTGIPAEVAKP